MRHAARSFRKIIGNGSLDTDLPPCIWRTISRDIPHFAFSQMVVSLGFSGSDLQIACAGSAVIRIEHDRRNEVKQLALGIMAAGLLAGVSLAQTTLTAPNSSTDRTTLPRTEAPPTSRPAAATTADNAAQPARGANSFTMGEAKSRIEKNGFSDVSDLKKDDDGVWRGSAKKNGTTTNVWLDYKGNTGTGS
jgi:hypothetical protein